MSTCEKCWSDAHRRALGAYSSVTDAYHDLLKERKNNPCTPEQQAGDDARVCSRCHRRAVHQYTGECMACGGNGSEGRENAT